MNQSQYSPSQNYYPISVPSAIDNAQPSWLFHSPVQDSAPVQPGDNSGFIQPQSIYSGWSLQDNGKSPFQQLQQPSNSDPWVDVIDKRSGQIYYWNTQTHETTSLGAQKPSAVVSFQQQPHPQPMMFAPSQMNNTFVQSNCIPYAMHNTNYPVYADEVPSHMIRNKTFNSRSSNSPNTHAPRSKNYYGPSSEANIVKRKLPAEANTASSKRPALSEDDSNSPLRYKCSYCNKLFKKLVGLEAHIKIVHPSYVSALTFPLHEDSAGSTGVPFTKTIAVASTTTTGTANTAPSSAAPAPVTESPGMAEFQCLVCKKNFKSSIALKQHSAANHVDDPASVQPSAMSTEKTFNCLQCSKSFSNPVAMEQHLLAKHGFDRTGKVSATSRTEDCHTKVAQPRGNVQNMAPDSRAELQRKIEGGNIEEPAASSSGVTLARADIHGEMEGMDVSGPENSGDLDASSANKMEGDVAASDHPSSQLRNDEPNPYATVTEDVAADAHQGGTDELTLAREALQLEHGEIETSIGESLVAAGGNNSSSVSGAAPTHQALTCTLCNKTFKLPYHLKQHYTSKHQGFASPTTSTAVPVAVAVAVAVANPNSVSSANIIETPGSDEFRCKLCNKKLKNSIGLQQHLAMKHPQIE